MEALTNSPRLAALDRHPVETNAFVSDVYISSVYTSDGTSQNIYSDVACCLIILMS